MQLTMSAELRRLDEAYQWLCDSRKKAPPNADVWDLRFRWEVRRESLLAQLEAGAYSLTPMQVVGKQRQVMWSAEDALVLKWVALNIMPFLPLHSKCEHVRGHGGGRTSLLRMQQAILREGYSWVCRTDIQGYYANINKNVLLEQLALHVKPPVLMNLLSQYIHYCVEDGGEFYTPERGIARGCALSPLMGALHLWALDHHFSQQDNIYYARYMDDVVIMTKTRWSLRRHVKALNGHFEKLGFHQHPDKTFIGLLAKGFDWMGAQLGCAGLLGIAPRALTNHWTKVWRLYEQTRSLPATERARRVSDYLRRWQIWGRGGLGAGCLIIFSPWSSAAIQMEPDRIVYPLSDPAQVTSDWVDTRNAPQIAIHLPESDALTIEGTVVYRFIMSDWYNYPDRCEVTITLKPGAVPSLSDRRYIGSRDYCKKIDSGVWGGSGGVYRFTMETGENRDKHHFKLVRTSGSPMVKVPSPWGKHQLAYGFVVRGNGRDTKIYWTDEEYLPAPPNCSSLLSSSSVDFGTVSSSNPSDVQTTRVYYSCNFYDPITVHVTVKAMEPYSVYGKSMMSTSLPGWFIHGSSTSNGWSSCDPEVGIDLRPGHPGLSHSPVDDRENIVPLHWNLCYLSTRRGGSGRSGGELSSSALVDVTWD
ncbi:reverse transcriptase domain-containing protein [Serratia liquefaciens]|uniref:reverse transcriptase domain-containing protein n=1 Tax=Serratia liquefaciens TaxID=614 RepID=UPI002158669A|nr:reverse transcriptase domain-containing protein [Serratia liquefaciens]